MLGVSLKNKISNKCIRQTTSVTGRYSKYNKDGEVAVAISVHEPITDGENDFLIEEHDLPNVV